MYLFVVKVVPAKLRLSVILRCGRSVGTNADGGEDSGCSFTRDVRCECVLAQSS